MRTPPGGSLAVDGRPDDGVIERVSDYHGQVRFPSGAARPAVGEQVAVVPNHACPVIDLYDSFVATLPFG